MESAMTAAYNHRDSEDEPLSLVEVFTKLSQLRERLTTTHAQQKDFAAFDAVLTRYLQEQQKRLQHLQKENSRLAGQLRNYHRGEKAVPETLKGTEQPVGEGSDQFLWQVDAQGSLEFISPSIRSILGFTSDKLQGRPIQDLATPESPDFPDFSADSRCTLAEFTLHWASTTGAAVPIRFTARPQYTSSGKLTVINGLGRVQSAENSTFDAETSLTTLAHEIRTPTAAIASMIELLQDPDMESAQESQLKTNLADAVQVLLDLTNHLLQHGTTPSESSPTLQPRQLLHNVWNLFSAQALSAGTQIDVWVDDRVPETLSLAEETVMQICMNLMSNALKVVRQGVVSIHFDYNDANLLIHVQDSGDGFDTRDIQRVWYDVRRESTSGTAQGFGLSITRRLIEALDGTIHLYNRKGEGATFVVALPGDSTQLPRLEKPAAPYGATPSDQPKEDEPQTPPLLLVDDNPLNRSVIQMVAAQCGLHLELAESGQAALEMAAQKPYAAVLIDLMMPEMDGWETARLLREESSHAAWPKLFAVSALSQAEFAESPRSDLFETFISKPVRMKDLRDHVLPLLETCPQLSEYNDTSPAPIIDHAVLHRMTEGDQQDDFLQQAIRIFQQNTPTLISSLKRALEVPNIEEAARAAHSLKSNAALMGAQRLKQNASALETQCRSNTDVRQLLAQLEQIEKDYAETRNTLAALMGELSS